MLNYQQKRTKYKNLNAGIFTQVKEDLFAGSEKMPDHRKNRPDVVIPHEDWKEAWRIFRAALTTGKLSEQQAKRISRKLQWIDLVYKDDCPGEIPIVDESNVPKAKKLAAAKILTFSPTKLSTKTVDKSAQINDNIVQSLKNKD